MLLKTIANPQWHVPFILLLCLLLFFPFLAARDFWELENHYAEVIRVMLLDGEYLVPKVNDTFFPESPPLYFWLAALFSWFAGAAGEWPIRLPSALSATELILVVYYYTRKRFDAGVAIVSAVVLATAVLTVHVARHVPVNMLFYLLITVAMLLLMEILVFDSVRRSHAYGVWLCMALACLTNGPLGLLFPAAVAGIFLALSRRWERFMRLCPVSGALLFLAVTAPWFAYLAWNGAGDWLESIYVHFYLPGHGGPDHQVFFRFPLAFSPWCFLFVPGAICLWHEKSKVWDAPILFLSIWFVVGLIFSEFSFGRHNHYLFLAYVPVAVALGFYICRLEATEISDPVWVWTHYSVIILCALFVLGGLSGPMITWYAWPFLALSMAVLGLTVVGLSVLFLYAWKRRTAFALVCGFAAYPVIVNLLLQSLVFPTVNSIKVRPLAEKVKTLVAQSAGSQVAIYNQRRFHDFNYYSQIKRFEVLDRGAKVKNFLDRPGRQFVLLRGKQLREFEKTSLKKLRVVLAGFVGSERWMLLSSCGEECERSAVAAKSFEQLADNSESATHGHDSHETKNSPK